MTHKTIVCSCGKQISTCRCPAPNKPKVVSDKPCTHAPSQVPGAGEHAPGASPALVAMHMIRRAGAVAELRKWADEMAPEGTSLARPEGAIAAMIRDRARRIEDAE